MNRKKNSKNNPQHQKIVMVSSRLMSQKGYKGASLQEIANAAGIHKSTIFHYFKNKEELLLAVLKLSIIEVTENLKGILLDKSLSPEEKLRRAISNHLELIVKYKYNVNVYLNEIRFLSTKNKKIYIETRKHYALLFQQIIEEFKKSHPRKFKALDSKIITFGILGMCNWVVKWYKGAERYNIREIANIFYQMIT